MSSRVKQGSQAADSGIATLHPAYFALVMATGIVSIASFLLGIPFAPKALFALNLIFYPVLWTVTLVRLLRHPSRLVSDLSDHGRAVGFLTVVAATCVMGSQFVIVGGAPHVAFWFWVAGVVLYVLLVYSVFTALTVKKQKPLLAEGINGGWLVSRGRRAVGRRARCLDRPFRRQPDRLLLLFARDVARRRDALLLDHLAHLLPLHLFHHGALGSGAAVLDQHGGGGDLDVGGIDARRRERALAGDH